jgi:hypothetical protein
MPGPSTISIAHPLAVVRPFTEVPPTILKRGQFLLASATTLASQTFPSPAPPAFAPPAPANDSAGLIAQGSHASSSLLMHVSLITSRGGDPPSVPLLLGPQGALLPPIAVAPSCRPDPDGSMGPAVLIVRACTIYRGQFSCGHFPGPYHWGSHHGPLHGRSL